jgi:hypothetical protein
MKQGYSGSHVRRIGNTVTKTTTDLTFLESEQRQQDLIALSQQVACLPRIHKVEQGTLYMDYVAGREGPTRNNARQAGGALRTLHDQVGYPHDCATGLWWLIELANQNLQAAGHATQIDHDIEVMYPADALIHSEPIQFVQRLDGSIVFIDIEGIGMGTRYRDLGFVYYIAALRRSMAFFDRFYEGYGATMPALELPKIRTIAGITALAYAGFADTVSRIALGLRLISSKQ